MIGFLVFKLYPFGSSLFYSFTDYKLFKGIKEFGIMNYIQVFEKRQYREALILTFKYAFMTVPLKLIAALFIAYILNFKIKGVNLFRTAYYIPSILGGSVAISVFTHVGGTFQHTFSIKWISVALAVAVFFAMRWKPLKKLHPIAFIGISALLGVILQL